MKRVETRVIKKDGNMKVKGFGAFVFIDHYRAAVCYCAVLTGFEGYLLVVARLQGFRSVRFNSYALSLLLTQ